MATVVTAALAPTTRKAIARTVLDLRAALEDDFRRQLASLGISERGVSAPPGGRALNAEEGRTREIASAAIERGVRGGLGRAEAVGAYLRDSAFTFLNRALGFRCLDERDLLRVDGQTETVLRIDPARNASSLYWRIRNERGAATSPREIWREAFRRAGAAISEQVSVLFDADSEYAALFPLLPTIQGLVDALNRPEISPETYRQDEFLGWVYQYYNSVEKDAVYARLSKGAKIDNPEDLTAATCLYTERYMVDYLLQNTLGALWVSQHPASKLPEHWPYFVRDAVTPDSAPPRPVREITLLDPACGSGHFLVRAFDLFVELYREEGREAEAEIPRLILERNLHGIDVDLRAVQLAALALYLKGCALAGPDFRPSRLNLVSADVVLPGEEPDPAYLKRFGGDPEELALVKGIWRGLKHAPLYGSLLHPERAVDEVVKRRREEDARRYPMLARGDAEWGQWKRDLLEGLREEFVRQARTEDVGQRLFGKDAARGVTLVEALGGTYDVVVANPPYQGSGSLDPAYKKFLEKEYKEGKRDLYAAFILRCRDFARPGGQVGMVTQQSWMFLRSFADLRKMILEKTSLTTIAHLGEHGFEESAAAGAFVALFTLRVAPPTPEHRLVAFRLIGPKSAGEKDELLRRAVGGGAAGVVSEPRQEEFRVVPETPFLYWLRQRFFRLLRSDCRVSSVAYVRQGLATADNERFTRFFWEVTRFGVILDGQPVSGRWFKYAKGGRYQKWAGLDWYVVDWANDGQAIKEYVVTLPETTHWSRRVSSAPYYFRAGLTYTQIARGSLGFRCIDESIFGHASNTAFPTRVTIDALCPILNSRVVTFLVRALAQKISFEAGHVALASLPDRPLEGFAGVGSAAISLKSLLVSLDLTERTFSGSSLGGSVSRGTFAEDSQGLARFHHITALLHTLEGINERLVCEAYELDAGDVKAVIDETGTPAGWYPLIEGLDRLEWQMGMPDAADTIYGQFEAQIAALPRERREPAGLDALRRRLRALYLAGPGASVEEESEDAGEDEEAAAVGGYIPIPAETFLEELSQKLKVHPITVANLLDEFYADGHPPNDLFTRRQVEDYFSFLVLRLLGYTWPTRLGAELTGGRFIPKAAFSLDGIIPLVPCGVGPTLEERLVTALEGGTTGERPLPLPEGEGERSAEADQVFFRAVVGRELGEWLRKDFFKRHVQQFKQRPIAWHFVSPERTFEAFVLYHKLSRDTLQTLRTRYAGGMLDQLRAEQARAKDRKDDQRARDLQAQIEDVEEFRDRLEAIERGGELKYRIRCRWKGEEENGRPGPYSPDIDDGVKVNIRPFQEAGVLAMKEVIKKW